MLSFVAPSLLPGLNGEESPRRTLVCLMIYCKPAHEKDSRLPTSPTFEPPPAPPAVVPRYIRTAK